MSSFPVTPPFTPAKGWKSGSHLASRTGSGINLASARNPKRLRVACTDAIQGIKKQSIRRIARRGGVKRIEQSIYQTTKDVMVNRIREVLSKVVKIVDHCGRKTVNTMDIVMALKDFPDTLTNTSLLYGYDWPIKEFPEPRSRTRTRTHTIADEAESACVAEIKKSAAAAAAAAAAAVVVTPTTKKVHPITPLSLPARARTHALTCTGTFPSSDDSNSEIQTPVSVSRILAKRKIQRARRQQKAQRSAMTTPVKSPRKDRVVANNTTSTTTDGEDKDEDEDEASGRRAEQMQKEAMERVAIWERKRAAVDEELRLFRSAVASVGV